MSADEPVVAASVIKVLIAIAAEGAFAEGRLDPRRPIRLAASGRTPGPVGFSLFSDDAIASSRDLVSAMLTISDNVAADALLDLVGLDTCNRLAADFGLGGTVIVSPLADMVTSIAQDAGFTDWAAMTGWVKTAPTGAEREIDRRVREAAALDPTRATRTTARDMGTLLRLIWEDQAGPPTACARVRAHMSRQLTRNRLAAVFPSPAQVAAKSGGLMGVIRNEVGVIEQPGNGGRFYAAVFTCADPTATELDVNAAIGTSAAAAVKAIAT